MINVHDKPGSNRERTCRYRHFACDRERTVYRKSIHKARRFLADDQRIERCHRNVHRRSRQHTSRHDRCHTSGLTADIRQGSLVNNGHGSDPFHPVKDQIPVIGQRIRNRQVFLIQCNTRIRHHGEIQHGNGRTQFRLIKHRAGYRKNNGRIPVARNKPHIPVERIIPIRVIGAIPIDRYTRK